MARGRFSYCIERRSGSDSVQQWDQTEELRNALNPFVSQDAPYPCPGLPNEGYYRA
jgi:hypothetical protein